MIKIDLDTYKLNEKSLADLAELAQAPHVVDKIKSVAALIMADGFPHIPRNVRPDRRGKKKRLADYVTVHRPTIVRQRKAKYRFKGTNVHVGVAKRHKKQRTLSWVLTSGTMKGKPFKFSSPASKNEPFLESYERRKPALNEWWNNEVAKSVTRIDKRP